MEGIDGITIGRLAGELGMSKSGLFAHFGSKEELQLATIDTAREIFVETVITPARQAERGLPRLEALMENWLQYMQREVFRGGCFFDAVRSEYNSRPPGPVRDAVWADFASWSELCFRLRELAKLLSKHHPATSGEKLCCKWRPPHPRKHSPLEPIPIAPAR